MSANIAGHDVALGCDVSRWQGGINWGVFELDFVIYKATGGDGGQLYTDGRFYSNAAGFDSIEGAYHFASLAAFDPVVEADHFASTILNSAWSDLGPGRRLAPMLDWEPTSRVASSAAWCRRWLDRVEDRVQQSAMVYSAGWCAPVGSADDMAALRSRAFCLAAYVNAADLGRYPCPPWGTDWDCWQYSSTGSVRGIAGACDTDAFRLDRLPRCLLGGSAIVAGPSPSNPEGFDMAAPIYRFPDGASYLLTVTADSPTGLGWVFLPSSDAELDATRNRLALPAETVRLAAGDDSEDARFGRHPVLSGPHKRDTYTGS